MNHERGHNTQFMTMGLTKYLLFIAIPSPIKNGDYTPWELSASMLGGLGSANGSTTDQQKEAMLYYAFASTNNPLLWAYLIYQIIKTPK